MLNFRPDDFNFYGRWGLQSKVVRLLARRGRTFQRGTLPLRRGGWYRTPGICFRNAYLNVYIDPARFVYCEGFYYGDEFGPFAHAWFIDRQQPDLALDSTLTPDHKQQYFGISIPWKRVQSAVFAEGAHASILQHWEKMDVEKKKGA